MKVSIILPTFNEADNIVKLIEDIIINIPKEYKYEIMVVDDNSADGTYEKVRKAFKDNEAVIPVLRLSDHGLAKSIRHGVEQSTGDQIIVMDTDFTHDPREIPRLLHVGKIYDLVSGSRFCSGGSMQDVGHYLASLAYNLVLRIILRTQVQDNLGGYFTIKKQKLMEMPLDLIFWGYGEYFFRLLHFVKYKKMSLVEIPAIYKVRFSGVSKSNFFKMLFSYTYAAIQLRCHHFSKTMEKDS